MFLISSLVCMCVCVGVCTCICAVNMSPAAFLYYSEVVEPFPLLHRQASETKADRWCADFSTTEGGQRSQAACVCVFVCVDGQLPLTHTRTAYTHGSHHMYSMFSFKK